MANELKIILDDQGIDLKARLLAADGTIIKNNIDMQESDTTSGYYYGSVGTDVADGSYTVSFFAGAEIYGVGRLEWRENAEIELAQYADELHSLFMLKGNKTVTHTLDRITIGTPPNQIVIDLTVDEDNNLVSGSRS